MSELRYRTDVGRADRAPSNFGLAGGECTIWRHPTGQWLLAFCFRRIFVRGDGNRARLELFVRR